MGFSLVSASVEHVRDQRGPSFCPSLCLCRSGTEFILNQDRLCHTCFFLSSVHTSRSIVKYFLGVRRIGKVLRVFAPIHTSSIGVVLLVTSPRAPLGTIPVKMITGETHSLIPKKNSVHGKIEACYGFVLIPKTIGPQKIKKITEVLTFSSSLFISVSCHLCLFSSSSLSLFISISVSFHMSLSLSFFLRSLCLSFSLSFFLRSLCLSLVFSLSLVHVSFSE